MAEPPQTLIDYMDESHLAMTLGDPVRPDMPLVHCNDAFLDLTQRRREELLGQNCRIMQHGHSDQPGLEKIRLYLAGDDERSLRVELVNFRADGSPFINMLTLTRIHDRLTGHRFIFASQFDVSAASARALESYATQLQGALERPIRPSREHDLYILSSTKMVADAAATVARARISLREIEAVGPLF